MRRSPSPAILLIAMTLLALAPAALGQMAGASMVYIQVEPQGLGEVGYYPSPGPAKEWPRATTPIGSFFTMTFTQGTYLYLEAKPYGCAELEGWEITPEDANWTYAGGRERIILVMDREYITVKAIFRQIPESMCPYIPVWRTIRIGKNELFAGLALFIMLASITAIAYRAKRAREEKRRREEEARMRAERVRERLLETVVDWRRPAIIAPWQVILFTCLKQPGLEEAGMEDLRAAIMDDAVLKRLHDIQSSGIAGLGHCYIADALDVYTGRIPLLGLKTYLALFNLAPSTDRITRMYLAGLDPDNLPTLWSDMEGVRELRRILGLIGENRGLQRRGLEKVFQLMRADPEYARRLREPPEYYATLLRFIQEWTAENLGVTFRGLRLVPEAREERREVRVVEERPPLMEEAKRPPPVSQAIREEAGIEHEERMAGREEVELPDRVPMPKWLADALDYLEREKRGEPEEGKVRPEEPKVAEAEPERPKEAEAKPEGVEVPVGWDELPAPLQRQIEGLGLTFEEAAMIAVRTMGRGEREVYREVNRLLSEKYPDMGEQDMIATIMTAINTITWIQAILEEKGVKRAEMEGAVRPVEGAASQAVERPPVEMPAKEAKPDEEAVKAAEGMEGAKVEGGEEGPAEAASAAIEGRAERGEIYDEVKVDRVDALRPPIRAAARELYLIDVPGMPASWIPTPLIAELFHGSPSCKPIILERRRHYTKDVVDELFVILKRICMVGDVIPVLVVGRPGYTLVREGGTWLRTKNTIYVERLKQILKMLREGGAVRYAVAMPFQVYKQYCMDVPDLMTMRKIVYVVDVDAVMRELSGRVPEGALRYLRIIASLSPSLLRELSRSPRQVSWRPAVYERTGEEEALAWAVRAIYSKGGPLTLDEVIEAGYKDYLDRFIALGMIERG